MGYSSSRETLNAFRGALSKLEQGKECRWAPADRGFKPQWFAYKVREALHIAALYPDEYPALATMAKRVKITIEGSYVYARIKEPALVASVPTDVPSTKSALDVIDVPSSADMIMRAWMVSQPRVTPLTFKQTDLSFADMRSIYEWARALPLRVVLIPDDRTLTLAVEDENNVDIQWVPEDGWPL